MALQVRRPLLVTWNEARLPADGGRLSQSPNFRFRDTEWSMKFGESARQNICLYLQPASQSTLPSDSGPFDVSVQADSGEGGTRRVLADSQKDSVVMTTAGGCIWWRTPKSMKQSFPEFRSESPLKFRVTIEEKDGQGGQNSISTADASIQTSPTTKYNDDCLESLSHDFSRLLDAGAGPDVELRCEGHTTGAHRSVLCSRSPVLAKMLQSDMKEGNTGIVNIEDMDADTFRRFVRYIYTARIGDALTFETALCLYEAGDMYAVDSLKKRCSSFLVANLMVQNACGVLAVADAHGDCELKNTVTEYVLENKLPLSEELWSAFCQGPSYAGNRCVQPFLQNAVEVMASLLAILWVQLPLVNGMWLAFSASK